MRAAIGIVTIGMLLSACSVDSGPPATIPVSPPPPTTTPATTEPSTTRPTVTDTSAPTTTLGETAHPTGTLDDPLPVGAVVRLGDWAVRVAAVTADATDKVLAANEFNEPPSSGKQFVLAALEATYTGDTSSNFWSDMSYRAVGASRVAYEFFDAYCGLIPDDIGDFGDVFPGGTISGNVCYEVADSDAADLVLALEPSFSFDDEAAYLSLDPTATPVAASTSAGVDLVRPAPDVAVGEVARIDDWVVRVAAVEPDALDALTADNQFNAAPRPGNQFFMLTLEATYTGNASSSFWSDFTYSVVGRANVAYESYASGCGVVPDDIDDAGEVFPGGTITGNACFEVAAADVDDLVLYIGSYLTFDPTDRTFLALDPAATPVDASTSEGVERAVVAGDVPVGEARDVGDWSVEVTGVTPDATQIVLDANTFNDPPAEGSQFFMVALAAAYHGDNSSTFWAEVGYKVVGSSNVAYESYTASCGAIPDDIDDAPEVFAGGTITGNVCFEVDAADAAGLVLIVDANASFDAGGRAFFALA